MARLLLGSLGKTASCVLPVLPSLLVLLSSDFADVVIAVRVVCLFSYAVSPSFLLAGSGS
jgi:hypothetical protein